MTRLRKAAIGLAVSLPVLAALSEVGLAQSAGFDRLASVRVDVGPMIAQGSSLQAEVLRADLNAALRRSLAGRIVGGRSPSLVVRVRSLSLSPYAGSQGARGFGGAGGPTDYLDGEALLVDAGGAIVARHPQLSALPSSSGGAWYDPASERRRVAAIAEHYAQWLSRTLPAQ